MVSPGDKLGGFRIGFYREEHIKTELFMAADTFEHVFVCERLGKELIQRKGSVVFPVEEEIERGFSQVRVEERRIPAAHGEGGGDISRNGGFSLVFAHSGDKKYFSAVCGGFMLDCGADRVDLLRVCEAGGR